MAIIPSVKVSHMKASLDFYTSVLDFRYIGGDGREEDPAFTVLARGDDQLVLSSHGGDGVAGQAILITIPDADALFRSFRARGLRTPGNPDAPTEVHQGPLDQTWGTREFYVRDPDGNSLRFVQGWEDA